MEKTTIVIISLLALIFSGCSSAPELDATAPATKAEAHQGVIGTDTQKQENTQQPVKTEQCLKKDSDQEVIPGSKAPKTIEPENKTITLSIPTKNLECIALAAGLILAVVGLLLAIKNKGRTFVLLSIIIAPGLIMLGILLAFTEGATALSLAEFSQFLLAVIALYALIATSYTYLQKETERKS